MRIERTLARLAVIAALGAGGIERASFGAVDVFLKLSGIEGESAHIAHQGSSDVMGWSWGIVGEKIVGEKGRPAFSELTIRKAIDKATPLLARGLAKGTHFPQGIITLRTQSQTQVDFARIVMEDVNITGILIGMSVATEENSETIALTYKRIGVEYFTIEANERSAFEWDVENNREGGVTFPGEGNADSDGDGLPDGWETKYNLDPQVNDAGLDRDQDGATNLEEYIAGTSPIDPNRVFRSTLSYEPGQRNATLTWQSAPDKTYRILSTETLGTPFGGDLIVPSAGDTTSVTLPGNALNQFYRVELVVPQ